MFRAIESILVAVLQALATFALPTIETQCGDTTVSAVYSNDLKMQEARMPFGYWKLNDHEVRVDVSLLMKILEAREARLIESGHQPIGSVYLQERINSLEQEYWPVDMKSLVPPESAWEGVTWKGLSPDELLTSQFHRLSMQRLEHSLLLENALYLGLAEIMPYDGQKSWFMEMYTFEEETEDGWRAIGHVWIDGEGHQIHRSCQIAPPLD